MSPIETILVSAIVSLAGVIAWLYKAQEAARKKAHNDTRQRITAMSGHIDECNRERGVFRERIARLEERMNACPQPDCPVRNRTNT